MKSGATRWPWLILFVILSSAAAADKSLSGSIRKGMYTAPDKSFQFEVPQLIDPGAFVRDVRVADDTFKVVMGDELCRRFFIVQYATGSYGDFNAFVSRREAELAMVDARAQQIGPADAAATMTTGSLPGASICTAMTFGADGQLVPSEGGGSDAGIIFIAAGDAYYELGYLVGEGGSFAGMYGIGGVEEVLGGLFADFVVLGPRVPARLPETVTLVRFIDADSAALCTSLGSIEGKSKSMSIMASIDSHMNAAQAKIRAQALKLGANAIVVRESNFKTSGLTGAPYMEMVGDALVCDSVPQYMAWEIHAAD